MSGHTPWSQIKRKQSDHPPLRYAPFWLPRWMRNQQSIWPWKSLADNLVWLFGPWRIVNWREKGIRGRGIMLMAGGGLQCCLDFNFYPGSLHVRVFLLVGFDLTIWWL